jgi:hypothetical protein
MSGGAKPANLLPDIYLNYPFSATASVKRITRREISRGGNRKGELRFVQRDTRIQTARTAWLDPARHTVLKGSLIEGRGALFAAETQSRKALTLQ